MEPKDFAVGLRLEHPQQEIDRIQYHTPEGRGKWLPAAEYNFVTNIDGRGVYSFCMCPGGVLDAIDLLLGKMCIRDRAGVEETLRQIAARVAGVGAERICRVDIVRKSIDARQKEVMLDVYKRQARHRTLKVTGIWKN